MSGVNLEGHQIRKGATGSLEAHIRTLEWPVPDRRSGCWPARSRRRAEPRWSSAVMPGLLGVIELKDIVKGGIKERFSELRQMGIKTVMITGDNPADGGGDRGGGGRR